VTTETPIACSLGADELPARLAQIRAIGDDALMGVTSDGSLRFRADDNIRERLEGIIVAESRCCSFLRFELAEDGRELVLSVTAPKGAETLGQELVDAFVSDPKAA
jgi:hypothetical protein